MRIPVPRPVLEERVGTRHDGHHLGKISLTTVQGCTLPNAKSISVETRPRGSSSDTFYRPVAPICLHPPLDNEDVSGGTVPFTVIRWKIHQRREDRPSSISGFSLSYPTSLTRGSRIILEWSNIGCLVFFFFFLNDPWRIEDFRGKSRFIFYIYKYCIKRYIWMYKIIYL